MASVHKIWNYTPVHTIESVKNLQPVHESGRDGSLQ